MGEIGHSRVLHGGASPNQTRGGDAVWRSRWDAEAAPTKLHFSSSEHCVVQPAGMFWTQRHFQQTERPKQPVSRERVHRRLLEFAPYDADSRLEERGMGHGQRAPRT